jgi:NADH:ubiquinone oxidoreductase subunit F (NADH-binding)
MPRLIPPGAPLSLQQHLDSYGPVPFRAGLPSRGPAAALIAEVESAGLTGRGGAGFPCGRKMRAVNEAGRRGGPLRGQGGTVLVANGAESEPASGKDRLLIARAPHLVIDGIVLAAEAVGAGRAYLCVPGDGSGGLVQLVTDAVTARERAGLNRVPIQVRAVPGGYLASQETALISWLNGSAARPAFVPPRPFEKGVHRRPTLVQNVETLAHVALIARYGADWFRELGSPGASGSALITVSGAVGRPGVYEIALGTAVGDLVQRAGGPAEPVQAVLAGGYFGGWLPFPAAAPLALSDHELRTAGAALGPGVLVLLPATACGLAETAWVTRYLASQNAGQCGPCQNGLPALAEAVWEVAFGRPGADLLRWTRQLIDLVTGRGACHLPDGTAGLVASALRVFAGELRQHTEHGPCARAARPPVLPVPGVQRPRP